MSINKVLSFLRKQGVLAISNNKRIDTELATSYLAILFESDKYSDQHVSNKDYFAKSVKNAFLYFDCNGFVYKIYTSLCYFFDELLSKEDYYLLADKLIHKISGTKHLSKYINMIAFAKNCKLDFDPSLIEFKKTEGMILKDEKSFLSALKRDFHFKRIVLCYDQLPGLFIFDTSKTFLDLDKDIYVYFFDVKGETYQFDDEGVQINKRKKTITVSLPMRSNVLISNSPIVRRVVQTLDDKTRELEKAKAQENKTDKEHNLFNVKKQETTSQTQAKQAIKKEQTAIKQEQKPQEDIKRKIFTSKEIRANNKLLAIEKEGLKKAITSIYSGKFFFYPAISAGRYKLSNDHLKTLDLTHGFFMKGFKLQTYELLNDKVKILGKLADGTIAYEVKQDCHVVVFARKNPKVRVRKKVVN